ncbi:uncharacterized protein LTR77_000403 [Saxophila tyrrhenica]|uniref:Heterokaryon incompatibility domain-containing protein n=1 Tax=Saxophila tyrrhenica TaxID=1690608 RepID=A0AAV9PNG4_9PEZI|nr:hypothetical protein LTR77_000403 [Saxophila tyrrhenica]
MSFPVRLLNTKTYQLFKSDHPEVIKDPRYAILSHRWLPGEIRLQDLDPTVFLDTNQPQSDAVNKIRGSCQQATALPSPLNWLWADTLCIDKTNQVEETRSINAMFDWYRNAEVCFTFLHDIVYPPQPGTSIFKRQPKANGEESNELGGVESEWFERGWTLQELLAPERMEFYDQNWRFMGERNSLAPEIERVTGISSHYLNGPRNLPEASVATKFSWMAGRVTGQVEDIAYSMIGLLDINMMPQYGEGRRAFMRLQRTLIETVPDESIFAWTTPRNGLQCFRRPGSHASAIPQWRPQEDRWRLLAPSPDCFKDSRDVVVIRSLIVHRPGSGYTNAPEDIHLDLAFAAGNSKWGRGRKSKIDCPLNCWMYNEKGRPETVVLKLRSGEDSWGEAA